MRLLLLLVVCCYALAKEKQQSVQGEVEAKIDIAICRVLGPDGKTSGCSLVPIWVMGGIAGVVLLGLAAAFITICAQKKRKRKKVNIETGEEASPVTETVDKTYTPLNEKEIAAISKRTNTMNTQTSASVEII